MSQNKSTETLAQLRDENSTLKAGYAQMAQAFGTSDPQMMIERYQTLETKVRGAVVDGSDGANGVANAEVLRKLRSFAQQVETLNGTITSMESQLSSLYSDKERLEKVIGASEVDDVIAAFKRLETIIMSMEHQLMTLYAGREILEVELGRSDPREIVSTFHTMTHLVENLRHELSAVSGGLIAAMQPMNLHADAPGDAPSRSAA